MPPGPVFLAELRSTSRRGRHYAARSAFVAMLLALVVSIYEGRWRAGAEFSHDALARLAEGLFQTIAIGQGVAIVAITPALVAGAIAEERARKTLHDLLASDLTSAEIVLGKLAARLLHVFGFLALGLPVLSLITLLGGIDPTIVMLTFAATAAVAFFLAALSIFVSSVASGPREAVFAAYGIAAAWLGLSPLIEGPIRSDWPGFHRAIEPVARYVAMINPFTLQGPWAAAVSRMAIALTGLGVVLATLATVALRPNFRADHADRRRWRWPRRLIRRPAIGDDPMAWKERHVARRAGLVGGSVRVLVALMLLGLAIETARQAGPTFRALAAPNLGRIEREHFNEHLRGAITGLYGLCLVGVSVSAAASLTSEREADTWTSLAASPLDGPEILRAKRAGAFRRVRPLVLAVAALGVTGLASGAIHPVGAFILAIAMPIYLAFAAALGTAISLHARSTARAMAATVAAIAFCHGGYLFCCLPFSADTTLVATGCTPALVYLSIVSYQDLDYFLLVSTGTRSFYGRGGEVMVTGVASLLAYALGAVGLNIVAESGFDAAVGRPTRPPREAARRQLPPIPTD